MNRIKRISPEAGCWLLGLLYLAMINPWAEEHLTLCLFRFVGFDHCPGCGLGRAISYLFHGEILLSFQTHPLGIFALAVIALRIISLMIKPFRSIYKTNQGEPDAQSIYYPARTGNG